MDLLPCYSGILKKKCGYFQSKNLKKEREKDPRELNSWNIKIEVPNNKNIGKFGDSITWEIISLGVVKTENARR